MYPVFKIFGVEIYLYNTCVLIAFLTAIFVFIKRTDKVLPLKIQDSMIAIAGADVPFIIAGAILHNKFFYADSISDFWNILFVHTGIAFLGGLIGGITGFLLLFPILIGKQFPMVKLMNMCVPSVIIGHAIGRIGCLLGGCCYGKPSKWGIVYKAGTPAYEVYGAERLLPVPIIETVLLLLLFCIVIRIGKKSVSIYLTGYSIIRFFLEFLRGDDRGGQGFLSPAQKICVGILIVILCVNCSVWHKRK